MVSGKVSLGRVKRVLGRGAMRWRRCWGFARRMEINMTLFGLILPLWEGILWVPTQAWCGGIRLSDRF